MSIRNIILPYVIYYFIIFVLVIIFVNYYNKYNTHINIYTIMHITLYLYISILKHNYYTFIYILIDYYIHEITSIYI